MYFPNTMLQQQLTVSAAGTELKFPLHTQGENEKWITSRVTTQKTNANTKRCVKKDGFATASFPVSKRRGCRYYTSRTALMQPSFSGLLVT